MTEADAMKELGKRGVTYYGRGIFERAEDGRKFYVRVDAEIRFRTALNIIIREANGGKP